MSATPFIKPANALCDQVDELLARAKEEPVFLTKDGAIAGVLISTEAWDQVFNKLEDLQDIIDVQEALLEVARGEDEFVTVTAEELRTMVKSDAVPT